MYGGKKVNGHRLYYFNPHMSFESFIKSINNRMNIKKKCVPVLKGLNQYSGLVMMLAGFPYITLTLVF